MISSCISEKEPTSSIEENLTSLTTIEIRVDSLNNIELQWEDLSENEVGYFIEKINNSIDKTDSIYLPENSFLYYDADINIEFEYSYRIGVISNYDSIAYSDPITIKYIWKWFPYIEFDSFIACTGGSALSFSSDEQFITYGFGGLIYSLKTKSLVKTLVPGGCGSFAEFMDDDKLLLSYSVYNVIDGTVIRSYDVEGYPTDGDISNNGLLVGLGTYNLVNDTQAVKIYDIDGNILLNYKDGAFFGFSNSNKEFLYSPTSGTISIVDVSSGEVKYSKKILDRDIYDADFSPDDNLVVIASYRQKVKIWNYSTDKITHLQTSTEYDKYTQSVEFTPDGKYLICDRASEYVSRWDISTTEHIEDITTHIREVYNIEISPSGKYIASYGREKVKVLKNEGQWEIIN